MAKRTNATSHAKPAGAIRRRGFLQEGMMDDIEARREAARILGRAGGSVKSERKAAAVRENGKKGGRPRKKEVLNDETRVES